MSEDLVAWLRAALDEDERVARRAGAQSPNWRYDSETLTVFAGNDGWLIAGRKDLATPIDDVDGEHMERFDPARVLAEVEAKRRILDEYEKAVRLAATKPGYDPVARLEVALAKATAPALERVVRLLAVPYAGRDGWREEWRP